MVRKITKEQKQGKKQKRMIIITAILAIIVVVGAVALLNNTSTELSTDDYNVTVKEITLDNVTIDKVNKVATYKDLEGGEYVKEDETRENGQMYEAPETGVYVFKGEDYASLMTYGKAYEIVVTSEKRIDGWYLGDHISGNALDVSVYRQNSNLFKAEKLSRVMVVWFEDFDKIYDGDTLVWEK